MDFYPPLNFDSVFDYTINDKAIAKFGFRPKTRHIPKKPITILDQFRISPTHVYHHPPSSPPPPLPAKIYNPSPVAANQLTRVTSNIDLMIDNAVNIIQILDKSKSFNIVNGFPNYYQPSAHHTRIVHNRSQLDNPLSKEKLSVLREKYLAPKLIRKLGQNEKIFHGQSDINRSYIYRSFIITSEVNLYENVDLVYKAIDEWKRIHPLLRCRVLSKTNPENNTKEGYFAYATDEKIKSHANVNYLKYKSNSSKTCEDIWKLLVEREATLPLDGENGLLWRLTFLEVKNLSKPGHSNFVYAVILAFDHAIMDGRSSYYAVLQLFSIIEDLYNSNYTRPKENPLLPSKEEIFKHKRNDNQPQTPKYYLKAPKFLDMENAIKTTYIPLKYLARDEEERGMIYTLDNKPFLSIKELVNISKNSNSKFRTLVIHKADLADILRKCKVNGVKLTSFLNISIILALRMMYEKFCEKIRYDDNDQLINYSINISLREFENFQAYNPEKNSTIGCYIGLSFNSFGDNLRFGESGWVKNFWELARRESEEFHRKLDNGEFINSIHLPSKKKEKNEFFYHFGNSNLGVLQSAVKGKKMIRVKQTFATSKYSKENFLCWFSNLIATIENQLCWTISYNTGTVRQEVITMFIDNLTKVIKELME